MIQAPTLRVNLNSLDRDCLSQIRRWRNCPSIMRWTRQNDLLNEIQHEAWFNKQALDPSIKMYGIFEDHELIGVCGLTSINLINRNAEFSIYLSPEFHGYGLGKEALYLLCKHGFDSYPLHIIWGESFDGNPAMKTFEQLGFVKDGIRREFYYRDGEMIDAHLYSVKKEELKCPIS